MAHAGEAAPDPTSPEAARLRELIRFNEWCAPVGVPAVMAMWWAWRTWPFLVIAGLVAATFVVQRFAVRFANRGAGFHGTNQLALLVFRHRRGPMRRPVIVTNGDRRRTHRCGHRSFTVRLIGAVEHDTEEACAVPAKGVHALVQSSALATAPNRQQPFHSSLCVIRVIHHELASLAISRPGTKL